MDSAVCKLCGEVVSGTKDKGITLTDRGLPNIRQAALIRGDDFIFNVGDVFHKTCKTQYANSKSLKAFENKQCSSSQTPSRKRTLRSEEPTFDPRQHCLFCGKAPREGSYAVCAQNKVSKVRTELQFQTTVRDACSKRQDDWGQVVLGRLNSSPDLFAYDAVYHRRCYQCFILCKKQPKEYEDIPEPSTKKQFVGRPTNERRKMAFDIAINQLEQQSDEVWTVGDLQYFMEQYLEGSDEPYDKTYIKRGC